MAGEESRGYVRHGGTRRGAAGAVRLGAGVSGFGWASQGLMDAWASRGAAGADGRGGARDGTLVGYGRHARARVVKARPGAAGVAEQATASLGGEAGQGAAGGNGEGGQASLVAVRVGMNGIGQAWRDRPGVRGRVRLGRTREARQERRAMAMAGLGVFGPDGMDATAGRCSASPGLAGRVRLGFQVRDAMAREGRSGLARERMEKAAQGTGTWPGVAHRVEGRHGRSARLGKLVLARGGMARRRPAALGAARRGLARPGRTGRARAAACVIARRGLARRGRNGPATMAGFGRLGGAARGWPGSDGLAALGKAGQEWQGLASWGGVWWARLAPAATGVGRQVRPGIVGRSWSVSHGKERQEWTGKASSVRLGSAWPGSARQDRHGSGWPVTGSDATAGYGSASCAGRVMARVGKAGEARLDGGEVRLGQDGERGLLRHVTERCGRYGNGIARTARVGMAAVGMAARGRTGRAWLTGASCLGADRTDRAACVRRGRSGSAVRCVRASKAEARLVRIGVAGMARLRVQGRGSHGCPGAACDGAAWQERRGGGWLEASRHHPSRLVSAAARGTAGEAGQGATLRPGLGVSGHG